MKVIMMLRRWALVRVVAALVIVTTGLGWYFASSSPPAKAATSDTILFIHGFNGPSSKGSTNTIQGGCVGQWETAESYFRAPPQNWTGNLLTVGFYRGDWQDSYNGVQDSCDIQFDSKYASQNPSLTCSWGGACHQPACDTYHYDATTEGSNNQDLGNIACQLAWYIYNQYTSVGKNVHVIAHSMGGLIIRYALDRVYNQDPKFPPFLYVPTVITLDSPHDGIPNPGGAGIVCGGCTMASNMQVGSGAPSYFINTLQAETNAPIGSPGEPTHWTLMASVCEDWTEGVPVNSALEFPSSLSGYPAVHKIDYMVVPNQQYGCDTGAGFQTNYLHDDYRNDTSPSLDAIANTCDNCSLPIPPNGATVHHSLSIAYQNTNISVPAPLYGVQNLTNGGMFFDKWLGLGGVSGVLEDPANDWYVVLNGEAQNFQGGGIYWSPAIGTQEVHGPIYSEYVNVMGGPTGALNFPNSPVESLPSGGSVSYFLGEMCSSGDTLGDGSAIYYLNSTLGAHEVQGCIFHEYTVAMGGPSGSLGFPTSDECSVGSTGNRRSLFQHGTITWVRSTGQLVVQLSSHPPTVCGLDPHNDFNGDGLSDVVGLYNLGTLSNGNNATAAYEWLGTGSGLNALDQVWSSVPNNFNWYGARWVSGDFNGDGQTDLVAAYNLGGSFAFYEWLGTSTGLNYLGPVYTSGSFDIYKAQFLAGDFNGDGKDDILAAYNLGSSISFYEWTSAGTSFKSLGAVYTSGSFDWTKAKWVSGDFNGDGKTDMAAAYNLGSSFAFYEWTSTGTGFKSLGSVYTSGSFTWAYAQFLAGDFNGDGKDDIVAAYDLGSSIGFYEWPSTGTGFKSLGAVYTSGSFDWFKAQFLTGDFNGDGKIDIMAMYNLGSTVGAYEWTSTGTGFQSLGDIYTTGTFDWNSCVWVP